VLLVVDDEEASRQGLSRELSRYAADYRIVSSASAEEALVQLEGLRAEGAAVALILADQWMPELTGSSSWHERETSIPPRGAV
jgi:thioredoxin reductase (NADPH)